MIVQVVPHDDDDDDAMCYRVPLVTYVVLEDGVEGVSYDEVEAGLCCDSDGWDGLHC